MNHTNNFTQMASTSNQQNTQANTNSYANKLKYTFPKKEQAIIINATNEIQTKEYIRKIGEITSPQNIIFASRISFNRICIYLTNKKIVDDIITNHKYINIENNQFEIRRLITPAIRVTISNVCPSIPHQTIEEALTKLNIKTVSQISFVRAGMQEQEYQHVLSFRRQVFINEEDRNKIPESIFVEHENTSYKLYLSGDTMQCNICKKQGHTENQCHLNKIEEIIQTNQTIHSNTPTITPEPEPLSQNTINTENSTIPIVNSNKQTTLTLPMKTQTTTLPTKETPTASPNIGASQSKLNFSPNTQTTLKKRQASEPLTEESPKELQEKNNEPENKSTTKLKPKTNPKTAQQAKQEYVEKKFKKPREESPSDNKLSIEELMAPLKDEINYNQDKYILSFETLSEFIEEAQTAKDKLSTALLYTEDIPKLLETLQSIHQNTQHRSLKIKTTKIINNITEQLIDEDEIIEEEA